MSKRNTSTLVVYKCVISESAANRVHSTVDSGPENGHAGSPKQSAPAQMEDVLRADYGDAAQKALNDAARAKSKPSSTVSDRRYPPSPASPVLNPHPFPVPRESQSDSAACPDAPTRRPGGSARRRRSSPRWSATSPTARRSGSRRSSANRTATSIASRSPRRWSWSRSPRGGPDDRPEGATRAARQRHDARQRQTLHG